jgi:hypothetical protein
MTKSAVVARKGGNEERGLENMKNVTVEAVNPSPKHKREENLGMLALLQLKLKTG